MQTPRPPRFIIATYQRASTKHPFQSIDAEYLHQLLTAPQCATATMEVEVVHATPAGWSIGHFGLDQTRNSST